MEELVSSVEIARLAGVKKQTVSTWKQRYKDFPQPRTHKLYSKSEIEAWLMKREKEK